jgi:hypothetical protein
MITAILSASAFKQTVLSSPFLISAQVGPAAISPNSMLFRNFARFSETDWLIYRQVGSDEDAGYGSVL